MHITLFIAPLTAAIVAVLTFGEAAYADLQINVNKSSQRMTVTVDGKQLYDWPVSTGGAATTRQAATLSRSAWKSITTATSGTTRRCPIRSFSPRSATPFTAPTEQRNLGRPVSHGCVRLSVKNAATLWELVKRQKMANTTVVLSGGVPGGARPPAAARSRPMPLTADDASDSTPSPQSPTSESSR